MDHCRPGHHPGRGLIAFSVFVVLGAAVLPFAGETFPRERLP